MGRRVILALAVGLGLIAASARAQVVLAPTVYAGHHLRANAVTAFTVGCPAGYLAAGGGVSTPAPGTTLLRVAPAGLGAYAFRLGNPRANGARRVTAAVACRRTRVGGSLLKLLPVKVALTVGPGAQKSVVLPCPAQTTPAGFGVDLAARPAKSAASFSGAALELRASTASLRGFGFTLRNSGRRAHRAVAYGNCVTVVRSAGARPKPLRVKITTFTELVPAGRRRVGHVCPTGWFSLGVGYTARAPSVSVVGAATVDRGGRWWIENAAGEAKVGLQLACGSLER
jgi:hypothetical protein